MLFSRSVMSNSLWPHRLHRLLFFSQLFVRPPQTAVLLFCISFPWGWSWCLSPVKCHEPLSIVHQALCVSDLGREKPNRVLSRECTGHRKHPLPTTKEKTLYMDIIRWSTQKSDWLYSLQPKMEKLSRVSKNKTGSWLWLRSWAPYCQIQTEIEESGEKPLDQSGMT